MAWPQDRTQGTTPPPQCLLPHIAASVQVSHGMGQMCTEPQKCCMGSKGNGAQELTGGRGMVKLPGQRHCGICL